MYLVDYSEAQTITPGDVNMDKHVDMVRAFHEKHSFPVGIRIGDDPKTDLVRVHLIGEECAELALALANRDVRQVADSLGDLAYVVFGAAVAYGLPLREVFEEIHKSNMTKAVRDPNDTRLRNKGDSYVPPNIQEVLDKGPTKRPTVVCLCGSTRFKEEFERVQAKETLDGKIVLSVGAGFVRDHPSDVKARLDELHKRKIDIADEVLILNVGGYMGPSTISEYYYAVKHGKRIRSLEPLTK